MSQPAPVATPTRWWATRPGRQDLAPISTGRAYLEVGVVFGVFFASGIAAAGFDLNKPLSSGTWTWSNSVPSTIAVVSTTVLCILVPVLVAARRGATRGDLGIGRPGVVAPSPGIRMAAWALLAIIAGGLATSALARIGGPHDYHFGALNAPGLLVNLVHALQAGFIEEIVVLAFVVTTLEQARRPRTEIVVVALVLRMSYHIYYGWGVFGVIVWASVFLWLFLRLRTIVPLIVVHSLWDFWVTLESRWSGVGAVAFLAFILLFGTAIVLWLVERSDNKRARQQVWAWPPGGPFQPPWGAPGWYPPAGAHPGAAWPGGAWGPPPPPGQPPAGQAPPWAAPPGAQWVAPPPAPGWGPAPPAAGGAWPGPPQWAYPPAAPGPVGAPAEAPVAGGAAPAGAEPPPGAGAG